MLKSLFNVYSSTVVKLYAMNEISMSPINFVTINACLCTKKKAKGELEATHISARSVPLSEIRHAGEENERIAGERRERE